MENPIVRRRCAGMYIVSRNDLEIEVYREPEIPGAAKWMARARWDRLYYSDPMITYREAKDCATDMLSVGKESLNW